MRRNPDLLAVFAIALYVWVGAVQPYAAPEPRPTPRMYTAQVREALKTEAINAIRGIFHPLRTFH